MYSKLNGLRDEVDGMVFLQKMGELQAKYPNITEAESQIVSAKCMQEVGAMDTNEAMNKIVACMDKGFAALVQSKQNGGANTQPESKSDNTMLYVGGAVAALLLFFIMS